MSNADTVFGIDLGTTYSCIAYVDEYGHPVVVKNSDGQLTTPSVVELSGNPVIVGEEAKKNAVLSPDAVVSMVKRHMGEEGWRFSYGGQDYTPEQISAFILKKLVNDAQTDLNHPIKKVVITCPAYFGLNEREATAAAGKIADLDVLEIINEPTAAAICYSLKDDQQMPDQTALVYDLGGGTFDVTMIEIKQGAITVIATGGDHHLGGRDWDSIIVQYLAQAWMQETGMYDDPTTSPETLQDLWLRAEEAKKALTTRDQTIVRVTYQGQAAAITLTRDKFNELTANLLDRTIELTRLTLNDAAAKGYTRFDQLLLVGGSTKMPQVKERLTREFSMDPRLFDPDEAVAKGAALYGFKLSVGQKIQEIVDKGVPAAQAAQQVADATGMKRGLVDKMQGTVIRNVISHSFGVVAQNQLGRQVIANLVIRQHLVPATEKQTFGTVQANQQRADIRIMENDEDSEEVADLGRGREIGAAELQLPPGLPQGSDIEVTFEINEQGRLDMTAREVTTGRIVNASIETKAVMSDQQIDAARSDLQRTGVR